MTKKMKRLPDSELEIMLIIWEAGKPVQRSYVDEKLKGKKEWTVSTILNLLSRLIEKGFLTCEKQGKMNIYTAAVDQDEYLKFESSTFLEKLYGNSIKKLVSSMYRNESISDEDMTELREFLESEKER